jgi:hypothetical protein
MMRRLPLWFTLLPLAAGIAAWWYAWSGWADGFAAVMRAWFPAAQISVTGFPYRMETELVQPRLAGSGRIAITASADRARFNRGPWRPELTVIQAQAPNVSVGLDDVLRAQFSAPAALTSVHVAGGRLLRFSSAADAASVRLGFVDAPLALGRLELHVRERSDAASPGSPDLPPRGEFVVHGKDVRIGKAAPLAVELAALVQGAGRLTSHARWLDGGSIEIKRLDFADSTGSIAEVKATLVPDGADAFILAGTITTVCPASVAARLNGTAAPSEQRLRVPMRLALRGRIGADQGMLLDVLPADLATRPRRGQLPPCPKLG